MPKAASETARLKLISDLRLHTPKVRQVLQNLCAMAIRITGADAGDISIVGKHTAQLYGSSSNEMMEIPRDQSATDHIIKNPNAQFWFEDLAKAPQFEANLWKKPPYNLCAAAAAPLMVKSTVIGAIWVGWHSPQRFDSARNAALCELAGLLSDNLELHAFSSHHEAIISELRGEKALQEAMILQSDVAIAMFDDQMRCLKASPRWITEFTPKVAKYVGRSLYDLIPQSRPYRDLHRRLLATGERYEGRETAVAFEPQTCAYYDWSAVPWHLPSGKIGGLIISTQNVTDRVQDRFELEIDRARLDLAVRISKMTVFEYDYRTGVLKTISGVPWWGDVPAMPIERFKAFWLSRIAPEYQVEAMANWNLHEETGVPLNIEYRRTSDGQSPEWVQLGAAIVKDPNGDPMRIIGVFRDVTHERRTLDALNEAQDQLKHEVELDEGQLVTLSETLKSPQKDFSKVSEALGLSISDSQKEEIAQLLDASASAMAHALNALKDASQSRPLEAQTTPIESSGLSSFLPLPPGLRVLIAEDNPMNQQILEQVFESVGVHHDVADNGQDALDAFEVTPYQLVLMDLHMPICDGFEACRALRVFEAQFGRRPTRIVIMTADDTPGLAALALEAGADEFLLKPLNARQILEQAALSAQDLYLAHSTTQVA